MDSKLFPRKVQTKVKHYILEKYLKSWGGIILNGLAKKNITQAHFVYIDCNSFTGRYAGELEDEILGQTFNNPVYGSPIIGIQALDELRQLADKRNIYLKTNVILIEEKPSNYEELKNTLSIANVKYPIIETANYENLDAFQIAITNGDSTSLINEVIRFTQSEPIKFSLFFADPYGPKGIPLKGYIDDMISADHHDVIINLMYQDLHKKTGLITNADLDSPAVIKNYDRVYGDTRWQDIVQQLLQDPPENKSAQLEYQLMEYYREVLQNIDERLTIKPIGLKFSESERTIFYLYLTTHDPTGALKINSILYESEFQQYELKWRIRDAKQKSTGQMPLFDLPHQNLDREPRPTTIEIANDIHEKLSGSTLELREIYRIYVNEIYFASEIKSAIRLLHTEGKSDFDQKLENSTLVEII